MPRISSEQIRQFVSRPSFDPDIVLKLDPRYPRISIVIPSYNPGQFLEQTLLSILNQNYPNTEIIVMDGGSTDGTLEIIKRYEPYIARWVSEPDGGQFDAICRGLEVASGEILAYQNADDLYVPFVFETVAREFRGGADLLYGNTLVIDSENNILREFRNVPASLSCLFYSASHIPSQAAFWERAINQQLLVELKGSPLVQRIHFGMERFIFGLALAVARRPLLLRRPLGCFRIHSSSKTFQEAGPEVTKESSRARVENRLMVREFVQRGYISPFSWTSGLYCWVRHLGYLLLQGDLGQIRRILGKAYLVRYVRRHYE